MVIMHKDVATLKQKGSKIIQYYNGMNKRIPTFQAVWSGYTVIAITFQFLIMD